MSLFFSIAYLNCFFICFSLISPNFPLSLCFLLHLSFKSRHLYSLPFPFFICFHCLYGFSIYLLWANVGVKQPTTRVGASVSVMLPPLVMVLEIPSCPSVVDCEGRAISVAFHIGTILSGLKLPVSHPLSGCVELSSKLLELYMISLL